MNACSSPTLWTSKPQLIMCVVWVHADSMSAHVCVQKPFEELGLVVIVALLTVDVIDQTLRLDPHATHPEDNLPVIHFVPQEVGLIADIHCFAISEFAIKLVVELSTHPQ